MKFLNCMDIVLGNNLSFVRWCTISYFIVFLKSGKSGPGKLEVISKSLLVYIYVKLKEVILRFLSFLINIYLFWIVLFEKLSSFN